MTVKAIGSSNNPSVAFSEKTSGREDCSCGIWRINKKRRKKNEQRKKEKKMRKKNVSRKKKESNPALDLPSSTG